MVVISQGKKIEETKKVHVGNGTDPSTGWYGVEVFYRRLFCSREHTLKLPFTLRGAKHCPGNLAGEVVGLPDGC